MEITRINSSLIKVIIDRTKMHIEFKTVLDKPVKEVSERAQDTSIPGLQIIGTLIYANDLYVGVKEDVAVISNHASHIKDRRETIMLLYKLKVSIKELCYTIKCSNKSKIMQFADFD